MKHILEYFECPAGSDLAAPSLSLLFARSCSSSDSIAYLRRSLAEMILAVVGNEGTCFCFRFSSSTRESMTSVETAPISGQLAVIACTVSASYKKIAHAVRLHSDVHLHASSPFPLCSSFARHLAPNFLLSLYLSSSGPKGISYDLFRHFCSLQR